MKPILVDECHARGLKNYKETNVTLRTSIIHDKMPKCSFKFCTLMNEPYIQEGCSSGLELNIIRAFEDTMRFKVI